MDEAAARKWGVWGGVRSSSSASADPAAVSRDFLPTAESETGVEVGFGTGTDGPPRVSSLIFFLSSAPPAGEVLGEEADEREGTAPISTVEYWPPAPRRPMIAGSRWCSWGMALKRCVISRAPWRTALVARGEVAML